MSLRDSLNEYLLVAGVVVLVAVVALALLAFLARRGVASDLWRSVASHRLAAGLLLVGAIILAVLLTTVERGQAQERFREREARDVDSISNLIADPLFAGVSYTPTLYTTWLSSDPRTDVFFEPGRVVVVANSTLTSSPMAVRPGSTYRYSIRTSTSEGEQGQAQARMLWLDPALEVLAWDDTPPWQVARPSNDDSREFHTGAYTAPAGAAHLRFEIRNLGPTALLAFLPKVSQDGVYIEQHPNGAQGSLAFSFDWETVMGGPIHSKGMEQHDVAGAEAHGLEMREGADWLADLFDRHDIEATFYATGYNLLEGNTERRTFAGNPIYTWASPEYFWDTDWWLTHPWYSDDPFGNAQTHPAWYFGDQTRKLLQAGHEIAPHTFGHLYVRGSNPEELAVDADEWLKAAGAAGVSTPATFAFPWRSSNSLTADFYKVLYDRGVRAVTRVYERDLKDLYTIGAARVYSDIAVMPDFLLGAASPEMGEESAGEVIGEAQGLQVIREILNRRGTTSFWQHPEQLAEDPRFAEVRRAWESVAEAAARERDSGKLWIGTVAEITAYQRDLKAVTTSFDCGLGGCTLRVNNSLDRPVSGVTLTLPGDVKSAISRETDVRTVYHPDPGTTRVSDAGQPQYPTRQLVLPELQPGTATIIIEWAPGQEPVR